jgi:preprotein translocase subunit Sss1
MACERKLRYLENPEEEEYTAAAVYTALMKRAQ